jgi:ADP-ribose pyrophosphatase
MGLINRIYKGRIIELLVEDVALPNGATVSLAVVRHPGAAAVVALDRHDNVVLVRQFRHAAGGFIWEIPAGTLGPDEIPRDCAARELLEETGLHAGELSSLGTIFTAPGFCDERIHLFLARDLSPGQQCLEHDEVLTVERFPFQRTLDMIASGTIQDAKSIAGLHLAACVVGTGHKGTQARSPLDP